jgi:hypothetical protein
MRTTERIGILLLTLCLLGGCGSSGGSTDQLRHAISGLQSAIQTYNRTPQGDVLATAATCRTAHTSLSAQTTLANPASGSSSLDTALKSAYQHALAGFADCAASAPYDYQRMVRAQREIDAANMWIARARTAR